MIVVNPTTRQFNIPGADLVFGVTDDSGSEIKHFQCPRYVGNNLDIASSFVRMNYRNANGEIDSYLVQDLSVDGNNVLFNWELTKKVTAYRGNINFVMCVVGPDAKVKWHTTLGRGQVLEGLEPDSAMIEQETADVVAQLIALVEAQSAVVVKTGADQVAMVKAAAKTAQDSAVVEIESKRANSLASIPADYTSLGNAVGSLVRDKAGAIVCEAEGTAIAVKDASGNYLQGLRIFGRSTQDGVPTPEAPVDIVSVESPVVTVAGKNLIPNLSAYSGHGITITPNQDGSVTINGKTTNSLGYRGESVYLPGGTYTLKCAHVLSDGMWLSISNGPLMIFPGANERTYTLESGEHWLYFYINSGVELNNLVLEAQLELGDMVSAYEPYVGKTIATARDLCGIPVASGGNYTDSNGQQWICDEVDLERGVYVKRIGENVYDGSADENWWLAQTQYYISVVDKRSNRSPVDNALICSHFNVHPKTTFDKGYITETYYATGNVNVLLNYDDAKGGVDNFKAWLQANPMTLKYILATPVETPLSETEIAAYRNLHTNKPNTTILNDRGAYMKVEYAADTKLYIDNKLAALVGNT